MKNDGQQARASLANQRRLITVKLVHSIVWAFFVACIVAAPILALNDQLGWATVMTGIVFVEILVLLLNRGRCPLTPVAARYTTDRRANFDIFLPEWLARYNKALFGSLYLAGSAVVAYCWLAG